jgi:hypothetical protein
MNNSGVIVPLTNFSTDMIWKRANNVSPGPQGLGKQGLEPACGKAATTSSHCTDATINQLSSHCTDATINQLSSHCIDTTINQSMLGAGPSPNHKI